MAKNKKEIWTKDRLFSLDSTNSYLVRFKSTTKFKRKKNIHLIEDAFVRGWDLEFYLANNVSVEILAEPINEV